MPPVCVTRVPCHPGGRAASGVKYELRVPGRSWRSSSCSLALFPRQGRRGRSALWDPSTGCVQPRCPSGDTGTSAAGTALWPWGSAPGQPYGNCHPRGVCALSLALGCRQKMCRVIFPHSPYISVASEVLEGLNVLCPASSLILCPVHRQMHPHAPPFIDHLGTTTHSHLQPSPAARELAVLEIPQGLIV